MTNLNFKTPPDHTKEYLGGDWWRPESYYWDGKEGAYYYINGTNATYDKSGWNYIKVTDEKMLSNLKKKYNRGNDFYGPDYNPLLETTSTISTKSVAGVGPAVKGTGGSLRYPADMLIDEAEDFVMFDFYDYKPPFQERNSIGASLPYMTKNGKKVRYQDTTVTNFSLDQYNQSGNLQEYFNSPAYKQILLYMPDDVQDAYSAQWEGKAFGAAAAGILSSGGARGMSNKFMQSLKTLGENLSRSPANTAASLITGLTNTITGDKITQQDVFGGMSGVIKNPNVELLFQNMKLRTFDLTFKLAPYNVKEASTIREIIQTFKKAMLPQYNIQEGVNVLGYKPYQDGL